MLDTYGSSLLFIPIAQYRGSRHFELGSIEQVSRICLYTVFAKVLPAESWSGDSKLVLVVRGPLLTTESLISISLLSDTYLFFSTVVLPLGESWWHQWCPLRTAQHTVPKVLILKKKSKGNLKCTVSVKTSYSEMGKINLSLVFSFCILFQGRRSFSGV